ncbi:MAG TPA: amidohydrolase [Thermoanaerobaculia bacterium]|nr:amidohydrolase [Thermoanaerobaculia bacterium]
MRFGAAAALAVIALARGGGGATLFENGKVIAEPGAPAAELSILVEGGRVAFVGPPAEARHRAPGAVPVDLAGAFVYPGFADAHGHLAELGKSLESADLKGLGSAEACAEKMRARAVPAGTWAEGDGWDQNLWTPKEFPDARTLDAVFPDRPAFARRIDGHAVWVDSAAMRAAGITRSTPDPPGGRIVRRPDGSPSGVFVDNAMDVVMRARPEPSDADLRRAFTAALASCASLGLTEVGDASGYGAREISVLRRMAEEGALPIRVYATIGAFDPGFDALLAAGPSIGEMLSVRAVKIYADGALGSRGAALLADYSDDPGNRGLDVTPPARIAAIAKRCFAAGFQVWIHAIGDRANRTALDAFEAAEKAVPVRDPRPRIEHAQVVSPEDRPRFARLGVIASIQPSFTTSDMPWAEARLSARRIGEAYAWRTLAKAGARLAGGSDFPVESNDPRKGIYAAVTREDADGKPEGGWRPEEDLSRTDAIALYTTGAAYAMFQEARRGSIAPGKDADFTVLDRDLRACRAGEILRARVLMTVVAGNVAHPRS